MSVKKTKKEKAAELKKAEDEKKALADARALVKAADADDEGEGDDEDEGEGDDDDKTPENLKKKAAKSAAEEIDQDDLEKSLGELEEVVAAGDTDARKDVLLEKAKTTDGLEKSEVDELYQILGKEPKEEAPLASDISKGLKDNEGLAKALDVSEFLQEQHTELCKSLDALSEHVEADGNRQHQFNLILAKAVSETGRLAKSMAIRLGVIEQQPARKPKAKRGLGQPLEKSFAGQDAGAGEGEELTKAVILDGLENMIEKSVAAGQGGATLNGIDLVQEATKFESFNQINPTLLGMVKEHIAKEKAH